MSLLSNITHMLRTELEIKCVEGLICYVSKYEYLSKRIDLFNANFLNVI